MANGTTPAGGSVAQTAAVALPMSSSLVFVDWLVHPVWPPPEDVLILAIGVLSPVVHMMGRALYRKIALWAGDDEETPPAPPVAVPPPAPPPVVPPPAPVTPPA